MGKMGNESINYPQFEKNIHHIWQAIRIENTSKITPIFNSDKPISSTRNMPDWYTRKAVQWTEKSHINYCVLDSGWEGTEAYELDKNPYVKSWVKNDHLGFEILYNYQGVIRKYRPDFIIQLTNGLQVVLETKGQVTGESKAKQAALVEWTQAVNEHGGFGQWKSALSVHPNDVSDIIEGLV
jgi:type III restriction enzyme